MINCFTKYNKKDAPYVYCLTGTQAERYNPKKKQYLKKNQFLKKKQKNQFLKKKQKNQFLKKKQKNQFLKKKQKVLKVE